ncbi:AvrE-family type 3 secretion system effector [Brenneria izadpanahii]|uniref:AvrE-family type 3 secretion system effector n=1 Tax=Brenneria izadpanahii TaxID=2722756 RepID=A0ABX7UW72_9GAMM|nr:AvrE-family type 3 secretion system effector [Brenneria izadpanahii]QTF09550.1 AvrE-family type 3 secretion system effector [Brenneria izadpanahii]
MLNNRGRITSAQQTIAQNAVGMEGAGKAKLQQKATQHSAKAAAGSLIEEGKRHASRTDVRQARSSVEDDMPARQRGRGGKLDGLLHSLPFFRKKSAAPEQPARAEGARKPGGDSLLDKMLAERPTDLLREYAERPTKEEARRYQQNFNQVRQNILGKIASHAYAAESSNADSISSHYHTPLLSPSSSGYMSAETFDLPPPEMADDASFDDDGVAERLYREMMERQAGKPGKVFDPVEFYGVSPESAPESDGAQFNDDVAQAEPFGQLSAARRPPGEGSSSPGLNLKLDGKGRLQADETVSPALRTLLDETLGKDSQRFLAHTTYETDGGERRHLLLGDEGKLFALKSSAHASIALHSSECCAEKKMLEQAAKGKSAYSLHVAADGENASVRMSDKHHTGGETLATLPLPGRLHESLLTGIYRQPATPADRSEEQVRLHDGKLYALDETLEVWQKKSDISFSKLSAQADNKLYAVQDKRTLTNLTDSVRSASFDDDIAAFAVNKRGQAAVLTDSGENARMHFMPSLDAARQRETVTLALANSALALERGSEHLEAQTLGMADDQFYVTDSDGKLFVGDYPRPGQREAALKPAPQPELERAFSKDYQIEGFSSDEHGRLNALVKDPLKQTHVCPLGEEGRFRPGWNLSDALVCDNQLGLTHIHPTELETVDLKHLGKLTQQEGALYYLDKLTQSWAKAEGGCGQLKKGLDGQAYVLKDGEVRKVSISVNSGGFRQGRDNVFSLAHVRNKPSSGGGLLPDAKPDNATAMAVINPYKFLVVSDKGDIRFHQAKPDSRLSLHPAQTLPKTGIRGEVKDIVLDRGQNLYALTNQGEVFTLAKAQWQQPPGVQTNAVWQTLPLPDESAGHISHIQNDAAGNLVVTRDMDSYQRDGDGWRPMHNIEPAKTSSSEELLKQTVFERLGKAMKRHRIPKTGVTVQGAVSLGGFTGEESKKIKSKFSERLSAHMFSPSMAAPRPLKNLAYAVQHQWQGRDGLKPLYQMQSALFKQLEAGNIHKSAIAVSPDDVNAGEDLQLRLEKLDLGERGENVVAQLQHFRHELEDSALHSVIRLGRQQEVVTQNGELNDKFKPSILKPVAQSLNPHRSGHDLIRMLLDVWRSVPVARESKVEKLLAGFVDKQADISHQKTDMARQRDPNDRGSLLKSRLILDTLTLKDLHQLVRKAELLSERSPDEGQIKQLQQELSQLRNHQYGDNPVKQFTDMGFVSDRALEADYDTVKAFLNAFRKENHGINMTSRTVLEAESQTQLESKLVDTLQSLEEEEFITFERHYGAAASSSYILSPKSLPIPLIPGASVGFNRTYALSLTRVGNDFLVEFDKKGNATGSLSVATGFNLIPELLPDNLKEKARAVAINKERDLLPDLRASGTVSGTVTGGPKSGLYFYLTNDELPDFIKGLTQGTLNPVDVMTKGVRHRVMEGNKLGFSLDVNGALEARAGVNLTDTGAAPTSAVARLAVGVGGGAKLMSVNRERAVEEGSALTTISHRDSKVRFFNQANVDAHVSASAGIMRATSDNPPETLPFFSAVSASVSASVDKNAHKRVDVTMKNAEPLTEDNVDDLVKSLGKHFKDNTSRQVLAALKDVSDIGEKLTILHKHFSGQEINSDERYEAVNKIKASLFEHHAALHGEEILSNARLRSYYNWVPSLKREGVSHYLHRQLDSALAPDNAKRIKTLMDSTPEVKSVLDKLRKDAPILMIVKLELKEDLKQRVLDGIHDKKLDRQDIVRLFGDRTNLRLGSIMFYQTLSKKEGLNTPTLILGGNSSATVSMTKNTGTIGLKYGRDQDTPIGFVLEGDIAKAGAGVATAMHQLKSEGMEMKS